MAWFIILMGLVLLAGGCQAQTDQTLVNKATGPDVVEAVVDLIRQKCIFDDDRLLLRRIAYAETEDGAAEHTFVRNGAEFYGGIWQISEMDFRATRSETPAAILNAIKTAFEIDWLNTKWTELQKPLHSGLAARMKIDNYHRATRTQIPQGVNDQATYWAQRYTINDWGDLSSAINVYTAASAAVTKACESPTADIVFLLDGSGSISTSDFNLIKQFVVAVVDAFEISQQRVRIGVIEYSTNANLQFTLSRYNTKAQVQNAVLNIPKSNGGTDTAAGLLATLNLITAEGRHKENIAVMAIVLTDGQSNSPSQTNATAERFHRELPEVAVFSVGVGSGAVLSELTAIATEPTCTNVFQLSGFTDIIAFTDQLMEQACKVPAVVPLNGTVSGSMGLNQQYYFKTDVNMQENQIVIKIKALYGGVKSYLSWNIRNPNQALYDYYVEVDDSNARGVDVVIPLNNVRDPHIGGGEFSSASYQAFYGTVVGAKPTNNQFELKFDV